MKKEKKKPILTEEEIKRKKSRKTKSTVAAFVLILGVGIMGNWYYQNSDFSSNIKPLITSIENKTLGEAELVDAKTEVTIESESEYFTNARLEREKTRDSALETLKESAKNAENNAEVMQKFEEDIAIISNNITIENKIESLVTAKGVDNCLAIIDKDGKKVDIIVDCEELTDSIILQIKEIAIEQLNCEFKDVTIIQSKNK